MNEKWTQWIDAFFSGEMKASEKEEFQREMDSNPELQNEFKLQQLVMEGAKRGGQRQMVQNAGKRYHFLKKTTYAAIAVGMALAVAGAIYLLQNKNSEALLMETDSEVALLDSLDQEADFDGLDIEYFDWKGEDSVILTLEGTLLSVTESSFLLDGKPYKGSAKLQYQEARKSSDIVKAGLSTTSGDQLLETQGMFSFKAFTPDGKRLTIDSTNGVYVQLPVDEIKPGMMLFAGVKDENGSFDWQNPEPLEKFPTLIEMADLDFYPPRYEPTLNKMKWSQEKKKRDSLYLSFEPKKAQISSDTTSKSDFFVSISEPKFFVDRKENGAALFKNKCASCHQPHKNGNAPKLFAVRAKWDEEEQINPGILYQYIQNWKGATQRSEYVINVNRWSTDIHPEFRELDSDNMDAIFDWVDSQPMPNEMMDVAMDAVESPYCEGIPPSKVLSVWNEKFNKTILASKEFQERMKAIHSTKSEAVFNKYANQLNKKIWEIDEEVAAMGFSNFKVFANERIGGVELDNVHMNTLRQFYQSSVSKLKSEAKKNRDFQKKMDLNWEEKVRKARKQEGKRRLKRENQNLKEEFNLNMKNVEKQLGRSVGKVIHGRGTVYNVDAYVRQATISRTTTLIVDQVSGKTAKITYNPLKAEVTDHEDYSKLYAYLFSKEMKSYQRVDLRDGSLNYSLNDDMSYDLVLVGINESGYALKVFKNEKGSDLGSVNLNAVSEVEFETTLDGLNSSRNSNSMKISDELKWLKMEQENYVVQSRRKKMKEFRKIVGQAIFPCPSEESESVQLIVNDVVVEPVSN